jgi:hypothetical protein
MSCKPETSALDALVTALPFACGTTEDASYDGARGRRWRVCRRFGDVVICSTASTYEQARLEVGRQAWTIGALCTDGAETGESGAERADFRSPDRGHELNQIDIGRERTAGPMSE